MTHHEMNLNNQINICIIYTVGYLINEKHDATHGFMLNKFIITQILFELIDYFADMVKGKVNILYSCLTENLDTR